MIYMNYDREALDAQYNNRVRFPHYADYFDKWKRWSAETRARRPDARLNLAYGPAPTEKLDIFPATGSAPSGGHPINIFIHGGYWHSLDKDDFSYVAEGMNPNGVISVVINYALAPDHDMDEIVRQVRASMAWIYQNAADFGGDPARISAIGHSAGGHLVCMALATDWPAFADGLPEDVLKMGCTVSGIYDLEAIRLCYLNEKVKLTPESARRNSPLFLDYPVKAPLLIVLGKDESEDYHRQTQAMAAAWRALDYPCDVLIPDGLDHFTIVDDLNKPGGELVKAQRKLMP